MIVLDSSAAIAALVGRPMSEALTARIESAASIHVPHLLDSEANSALRGLVRGRVLTSARAVDALEDLGRLSLIRYPASPLASRVWELRRNFTTYDATYLALAEALEAPLVTCDRKMASGGHHAEVQAFR